MVALSSVCVKPIKQIITENKDIKFKKKKKENLSLISSITLRKLRLRQKNDFLIKKTCRLSTKQMLNNFCDNFLEKLKHVLG